MRYVNKEHKFLLLVFGITKGEKCTLCVSHSVPLLDDDWNVTDSRSVSRKGRLDLPALCQDRRDRLRECISNQVSFFQSIHGATAGEYFVRSNRNA